MAPPSSSTSTTEQIASPFLQQLLIRTVGVILLLSVLHIVYNGFLHPLSKVPGPFLARYSTLWLNQRYFRSTWLEDVVLLHDTYGPVVRIAPNEVSFVDECALRELYGHGKASVKTRWYDTWIVPGMGDNFFATTNQAIHRRIRSRVSGTYSMSAILAMEELIGEVTNLSVSKLSALAVEGRPIRIDEWVNLYTFDVVAQLAMGGPIGFLERGQDVNGIIQSIHDGFYLMSNMGHVPWKMFWFHNPVVRYLRRNFGGKRMNTFDTFLNWLETRVDQRMREGLGDRRPDMLQYFINGKTPSSVSCGISAAAMNRSRELFGNDADKWVPERWMSADGSAEEVKRLRNMEQNLTTFGMGSRSCVGRNLAIVEVYKYIATFVLHFDAEVVNEKRPWVTKSQWFSFQHDFWIRLSLRKPVPEL